MRQFFCILVASLVGLPSQAGVRLLSAPQFDLRRSAGLFVGVRDFDDRTISPVPYAVDDAVDLAYELSMAQRPPLVPPDRVVLALSKGMPSKPESRRKLRELLAAGATLRPATRAEILRALDAQSRRVGKDGLLVVSFATHGISASDMQYLLAVESRVEIEATTLGSHAVSDAISRRDVPRALIFIDACRERLKRDQRSGTRDARSKARSSSS